MKHGHRFTLIASCIAAVSLLCGAAAPGVRVGGTAGSGSAAPAEVRVNQVGYATGSPKVAFVMLPRKVGQVSFMVSGRHGVAFRGRSSADVGSWNAAYGAVYRLDFSGLRRTGTSRLDGTCRAIGLRTTRVTSSAVRPTFASERLSTTDRTSAG